ncbi:MAG: deoxynucleoside kinase [Deltaproteobacteria bacterium]|nr:deoxynucleoside kinase [Deltaproteobacteria bacterium]
MNRKRTRPPERPGPRFLAVAGNIGAGKSTLVEFLSRTYIVAPYFEPNDTNPYLVDFYKDMKRWSFQSQVYFLARKFRIHQELSASTSTVIQDRTIYEDAEIFAENLRRQRKMSERDYRTYRVLYESIVDELRPPDLMIYLRSSLRTLRRRIRLRGRPEEQSMPRSYLTKLQALYDRWFESYDRSETLVVDTDELDYISDLVHRIDLFQRIESALGDRLVRRADVRRVDEAPAGVVTN